jgi:hypothetical protein
MTRRTVAFRVLFALIMSLVGVAHAVTTAAAGSGLRYDGSAVISTAARVDTRVFGRSEANSAGVTDVLARSGAHQVASTTPPRSVIATHSIADDTVIARGGTKDLPSAGELFSGAQGRTLEEFAGGLKHGQMRSTTAGEIRAGGGTVEPNPEFDPGVGQTNHQHVDVCLGERGCSWSDLSPNPVPKSTRFGGADYPFYGGYRW